MGSTPFGMTQNFFLNKFDLRALFHSFHLHPSRHFTYHIEYNPTTTTSSLISPNKEMKNMQNMTAYYSLEITLL